MRNTLTLKEVSEEIGMNYRRLYAYMEETPTREHMQPSGKEYPEASIPRFRKLKSLDEGKLCNPKTLAASIAAGMDLAELDKVTESPVTDSEIRNENSESGILNSEMEKANQLVPVTRAELLEAISEGVRRSFPAPVPVLPDDALLTLTEAHERYGLALSTLRAISFVEGRRRKVRRSDVLRTIEGMQSRMRDLGRKIE